MKIRPRTVLALAGAAAGLFSMACIAAPYLNVDQFGKRLQTSLEGALGRRVELSQVHFSLYKGPRFSVGSVTIHEDPGIGIEPIAYVQDSGSLEVVPGLWPLLRGRFVISSIRLDGASINLTKSGPAGDPGRWNFTSFVNRSVMSSVPAIHIRNSRINFKFGDTKSVFYLTETDLDIAPPSSRGKGWSVYCSAKPARTDRSAQGLGSFTLSGHWFLAPERVDMNLELDRSGLGEITALVRGQTGNIHGTVSSRLHLGGPIYNIGINGRLTIEDVHRWDLLPPQGQGWPIDVMGRLDLTSQQLELQSSSAANTTPPLTVRFRATDYLAQPHWAVAVNWNRFPVAPLMDLATHMGAEFPPKLKLSGSMDGAIVYSGEGSFQGQLGFHNAAVTIPDSPPVGFEEAYVIVDHGHIRLSPALVHTADQAEAQIEADYAMGQQTLDLTISTEAMKVASLRSQVALAAVPWLEQVASGQWGGQLHYHWQPDRAGWTGRLELSDAQIPLPGLADPLQLASARAQIDGPRVVLDQIDAQAGKVAVTGSYSYEPKEARPHRLRLRIEELDAADLEAELMPTLRHSTGLIARALGRTTVPDWLKERAIDGTVQIDDLRLAGSHLQNVRARLVWDVTHVELDNLQAKLDRAAITGRLAINLRGSRPSYKLTGKVKGLTWQSGKVDAEGTLETSGTGDELLANLTSEGTFTGSALDFGTIAPWRSVSGSYNLAWSPRLRLTGVNLKMEDETFTGRGATQEDGRLIIQLSSGSKEMRMSGTLARLKLEEAAKP
ncbi:conserved exported hypothetical protein [Candidatus Sulfopaludibacter sp. SbA6]|nr:conserved exported hypothetical protein [Candidatus Sulfopaludibacter sp. SbA6]